MEKSAEDFLIEKLEDEIATFGNGITEFHTKDLEHLLNCLHDKNSIIKQKEKQLYREQSTEFILCAAIWFDDGKKYAGQPLNINTGLVLCGHRHACIFPQIGGLVGERVKLGTHEKEQGFLTNQNRFVGRCEAATIAFNSGQIKSEINRLYSEDLY